MQSLLQKLDEARYHLQQMDDSFKCDRPEFIHSANAFINSARSVTSVMQKVGSHIPEFDNWYDDEKKKQFKSGDEDYCLLRNITDHQKPIKANGHMISGTVGQPGTLFKNVRMRIDLRNMTAIAVSQKEDGGSMPVPTSKVEKDFVVEEFDDDKKRIIKREGFIKNSKEYFSRLEKFVKSFDEYVKKAPKMQEDL